MFRDRQNFLDGVRAYVPALQYASELVHGQPTQFSLGTPAALDDDIVDASVDADAVAGTEESQTYVSDSPYGRTLILTPSADPGNAFVIDVYGFDYLRQPMVERFTGANGVTSIIYGKKAFYKVTKTKIVTPATNAITAKVGVGYRLGLPYKGDIAWAKENGVLVQCFKRNEYRWHSMSDAEATSGTSVFVYAEFPGYVNSLLGIPHGAGGGTDPVVTVELGGVAITGLTTTVDTSDATGLTVTDTPTTVGYSANNRFRPGDRIEIVSAAAAGAGPISVGLLLTPTQFTHPDTTDPATAITGDPRGTYEPLTTMDGVKEIIVGLVGDLSYNSSNNGGLHGIQHYYP